MDQYIDLLRYYDNLLALPYVQAAPKRSNLEGNRRVLQELRDGEPLTPSRVAVYGTAMRHKYQGMDPRFLGYDTEQDTALEAEAREVIRDIIPTLYERAEATGLYSAGEVVEELDIGVYPTTALDMVKLLALLLNSPEDLRDLQSRQRRMRVLN